MRALLPFSIILFLTSCVNAQTKKLTKINEALHIKEAYEVLKADTGIRTGMYTLADGRGVVTKGYFKNNKKDSLWISYGYRGTVSAQGNYSNDKKVGVWEIYDYNNELKARYDFDRNEYLFYKSAPDDTTFYNVLNGADTIRTKLDKPPLYLGGEGKISRIYIMRVRYPAAAKENNTQGKVIVAFTVDLNGQPSNYRVKKGIKNGLSEEALRVIKTIDGDWLPAVLNGKQVVAEGTMPLSFQLSDQ